ncbi:MAG: 2,4-dienoyl-CoA reductase, partial [Peptococcaceae bacterium]|nr:2,4-dienoyl-CoA reductase [Peptococcaceae bacterium]
MENHQKLFTPLRIKGMEIKNRIAMMPMATNMADAFGDVTDEHIQYYTERARGGVGLIFVENVCVDFPLASNGPTQLRFDHDRYVPRLSRLVEKLHQHGAAVALQLNHAGAAAMPSRIGVNCVSSSDRPFKVGRPSPDPLPAEALPAIAE